MNTIYIPRDENLLTNGSGSFEGLHRRAAAVVFPYVSSTYYMSVYISYHIIFYCISLPLRNLLLKCLLFRRRTPTVDMSPFTLLPTLACLILIVVHRARGFTSGAPEESCDSLTVNHTHVGSPVPGAECDATCRQARQLRWIGNSSADSFTYNCNETYQCELAYIRVGLQL